jgi:hypothetical protein
LEVANTRRREVEGLYRRRCEEIDDLKHQRARVENQRALLERWPASASPDQGQQQARVLIEEQRRLEEHYERMEAERERLRQQREEAERGIYTATQNQSNGETNRASAVAEWLKRIEQGVEVWKIFRQITGRSGAPVASAVVPLDYLLPSHLGLPWKLSK